MRSDARARLQHVGGGERPRARPWARKKRSWQAQLPSHCSRPWPWAPNAKHEHAPAAADTAACVAWCATGQAWKLHDKPRRRTRRNPKQTSSACNPHLLDDVARAEVWESCVARPAVVQDTIASCDVRRTTRVERTTRHVTRARCTPPTKPALK